MRYRDDPRDIRNVIRRPILGRYLYCFGCLRMFRLDEGQKQADLAPCPCGGRLKRLTISGNELFLAKVAAKNGDKSGAESYRDFRRTLAKLLAMRMPKHDTIVEEM